MLHLSNNAKSLLYREWSKAREMRQRMQALWDAMVIFCSLFFKNSPCSINLIIPSNVLTISSYKLSYSLNSVQITHTLVVCTIQISNLCEVYLSYLFKVRSLSPSTRKDERASSIFQRPLGITRCDLWLHQNAELWSLLPEGHKFNTVTYNLAAQISQRAKCSCQDESSSCILYSLLGKSVCL